MAKVIIWQDNRDKFFEWARRALSKVKPTTASKADLLNTETRVMGKLDGVIEVINSGLGKLEEMHGDVQVLTDLVEKLKQGQTPEGVTEEEIQLATEAAQRLVDGLGEYDARVDEVVANAGTGTTEPPIEPTPEP